MNDGEVDRRIADRAAADRQYNDALTRVDRALSQLGDPPPAGLPPALDVGPIRDRAVILPATPPNGAGWRGRLARFVWRIVAPVFTRQEELNSLIATHLQRVSDTLQRLATALPEARADQRAELERFVSFNSILVQYLQQITPYIDTKTRVLETSLEEVRMAATTAQRAAIAAKRQLDEVGTPHALHAVPFPDAAVSGNGSSADADDGGFGVGYLGFEDLFRGAPADIRARQVDYADRFVRAADVLDLGCGRGEFLDLLRERGVSGRGIDLNGEMVEECRGRGLHAIQGDALGYLQSVPDGSLGGLTAFQVVEHFQPGYLVRVLNTAHAKLRPGAAVIFETINAACWVAYFESYIRDITHVRPLHPETLKFLVVAAGFEGVDVHFRSPIAEGGRLQRVQFNGLPSSVTDLVQTMNANVDRLNERLFTYLDYAIIATKGR